MHHCTVHRHAVDHRRVGYRRRCTSSTTPPVPCLSADPPPPPPHSPHSLTLSSSLPRSATSSRNVFSSTISPPLSITIGHRISRPIFTAIDRSISSANLISRRGPARRLENAPGSFFVGMVGARSGTPVDRSVTRRERRRRAECSRP